MIKAEHPLDPKITVHFFCLFSFIYSPCTIPSLGAIQHFHDLLALSHKFLRWRGLSMNSVKFRCSNQSKTILLEQLEGQKWSSTTHKFNKSQDWHTEMSRIQAKLSLIIKKKIKIPIPQSCEENAWQMVSTHLFSFLSLSQTI